VEKAEKLHERLAKANEKFERGREKIADKALAKATKQLDKDFK